MNKPIYQAWRIITPVEGEPIPDGAEFRHPDEKRYHPAYRGERWNGWPVCLEWRAPVPVIPEDVAVDAIMQNRSTTVADQRSVAVGPGPMLCATNDEQLRELIVAKLRELSQEAV